MMQDLNRAKQTDMAMAHRVCWCGYSGGVFGLAILLDHPPYLKSAERPGTHRHDRPRQFKP